MAKGNSPGKATANNSPKAASKGNLEARLGGAKMKKGEMKKLILEYGIPETEANAMLAKAYREGEYKHDWSYGTWKNHMRKYSHDGKANLSRLIRSAWHLFFALTDTNDPGRNPDRDVMKSYRIFIAGMWGIPRNIAGLEKYLGKMVYLDTINPARIEEYVEKALRLHGRAELVGFSDGGRGISDYARIYGLDKINRAYTIASTPQLFRPDKKGVDAFTHPKVVNIIGDVDIIAPLEAKYSGWKYVPHLTYSGDHTSVFTEPEAMKGIAKIVSMYPDRATFRGGPLITATQREAFYNDFHLN
ncbi:hypothetical protein J4401_06765 [Candidatus Woesearchaeota archaeon]|nr:hypothetical protein [Candidatus Woesearchaeota archaeon]